MANAVWRLSQDRSFFFLGGAVAEIDTDNASVDLAAIAENTRRAAESAAEAVTAQGAQPPMVLLKHTVAEAAEETEATRVPLASRKAKRAFTVTWTGCRLTAERDRIQRGQGERLKQGPWRGCFAPVSRGPRR